MSMRSNIISLAQSLDQKQAILDKVGDLSDFEVLGDRVLVATFARPNKTAGGILLSDKTVEENRFQSKVHLVLKIGPVAFKYDGAFKFEGDMPEVGDWVMAFPSNGREFFLGGTDPAGGGEGVSCRLLRSELIEGVVANPMKIF
jgi:co-chaperonin GroES (HSP10)